MRFAAGGWDEPGPATVWTRLRVPVVAGEEPSRPQRVLAVADSANGVSAVLPFGDWLFINPELTVHLRRAARGEWICLDAETTISRRRRRLRPLGAQRRRRRRRAGGDNRCWWRPMIIPFLDAPA